MDQCHDEEIFVPRFPTPLVLDMKPQDLDTLFLDSVSAGDINNVRRLLGTVSDEVCNKGYLAALRYSTTAMVKLFLDFGKDVNAVPNDLTYDLAPLAQAIAHQNYEVANYLLSYGCDVDQVESNGPGRLRNALDKALVTGSFDDKLKAITLLVNYGINLSHQTIKIANLLIPKDNDHDMEIIKLLEIFKVAPKKNDSFNKALKNVARRNRSIGVAEYLLKNGANVDGDSKWASSLYLAAQKSTLSAAKFMKFLLESGADPLGVRGRSPGDQRGAQNLSKWLGMTWDELVESTKSARAK